MCQEEDSVVLGRREGVDEPRLLHGLLHARDDDVVGVVSHVVKEAKGEHAHARGSADEQLVAGAEMLARRGVQSTSERRGGGGWGVMHDGRGAGGQGAMNEHRRLHSRV